MTFGEEPNIELDSSKHIQNATDYFIALLKDGYSTSEAFMKTVKKYGSYSANEAFDLIYGIRR